MVKLYFPWRWHSYSLSPGPAHKYTVIRLQSECLTQFPQHLWWYCSLPLHSRLEVPSFSVLFQFYTDLLHKLLNIEELTYLIGPQKSNTDHSVCIINRACSDYHTSNFGLDNNNLRLYIKTVARCGWRCGCHCTLCMMLTTILYISI